MAPPSCAAQADRPALEACLEPPSAFVKARAVATFAPMPSILLSSRAVTSSGVGCELQARLSCGHMESARPLLHALEGTWGKKRPDDI